MICLKHQQYYNVGQFCVYCGNPLKTIVTSTSTTLKPITEKEYMGKYRRIKGKRKCIRKSLEETCNSGVTPEENKN